MLTTLMTLALAVTVDGTHTDTTFTVATGARLAIHSFQGDIVVHPWTKNAIRIEADHDEQTRVAVTRQGDSWDVQGHGYRHRPTEIDYEITAPPWVALDIEGVHGDISIDGWKSDVIVETVNGSVSLQGGVGLIQLSSVTGSVSVDGAKGRLQLSSVQDGVDVHGAEGEINAEAVAGDIVLDNVRSKLVEASSVNGDIAFKGTVDAGGRYKLATHSGDLDVALPSEGNATVTVATFAGEFETTFPVQLATSRPGRGYRFTLGTGKAMVELESFMGTINLHRIQDSAKDKEKGKHKHKDNDKHDDE
jgi:hypothetical protein